MAKRNPDGTVTLRTRGSLAYTPRGASSIARSARGAGATSIGGGSSATSGRMTKTKGSGYTGRSAYS